MEFDKSKMLGPLSDNASDCEGRIAEDPIWEKDGSGYSCRFPIMTHNIHDKLSECVIQVRSHAECIDVFLVEAADSMPKGYPAQW